MGLKATRELFWQKNHFLFDLDGTLYLGGQRIPGAIELLKKLELAGKNFFYFTNNSSRSDLDYLKKLKSLGFPCKLDQVVMSTHTLIHQLHKDKIARVHLLGTPAMESMLQKKGISSVNKRVQAVVVGFDTTLTYEKLQEAAFLIHQGLPYYVAHPDFFCPTEHGPQPDCGGIALMLEMATKRKPKAVMGKPHIEMIREVLRRKKLKKSDMILIGDRISTDLRMAEAAGIDSILVLSGDSKAKEVRESRITLSGVIPSVKDLL